MEKKLLTAENKAGLRILHTADWHLGVSPYNRSLNGELQEFLDWLFAQLQEKAVDVLVVAGDIFDSKVVPLETQKLYYMFLSNVARSCCRDVFLLAGNHDSVSFLNAPKQILEILHVHVIGTASVDPADCVYLLKNDKQKPCALLGAVPFLRDRDVRKVAEEDPENSVRDIEQKMFSGVKNYYQQVWQACTEKQSSLKNPLPVMLTGHLAVHAQHGLSKQNAEMEESYGGYTGKLLEIPVGAFPPAQYVALGHYHCAAPLSEDHRVRYSGSPIPLSFQERQQKKSVIILESTDTDFVYEKLPVPEFLCVETLTGSAEELKRGVSKYVASQKKILLSLICTDEKRDSKLLENLRKCAKDSRTEIINCTQQRSVAVRSILTDNQNLQELSPRRVFQNYLQSCKKTPEEQEMLMRLFEHAVKDVSVHKEARGKA